MSYLTHLKRSKHHHSCRWIVKYDDQELIREVKLIHNPDEYRSRSGRNLHTINGLIKILENDKARRNQILGEIQKETNETSEES
jgi:hypothetical protein|tara:strand:+ start:622 stop:873 length:252 start_codon:yes stop_codon:yes gene_type:complete